MQLRQRNAKLSGSFEARGCPLELYKARGCHGSGSRTSEQNYDTSKTTGSSSKDLFWTNVFSSGARGEAM